MAVRLTCPETARSLFSGWEDTMIWAALEGTMGEVWAAREEHPHSALILN